MKRVIYLLLMAAMVVGCTKKEDAFYTTRYEVVKLDANINLAAEDEALEAEVLAWVIAQAPVQVGGSYRLDFNRFDGGKLTVMPSAEGEAIIGDFTKRPAAEVMTFRYGEQAYEVRSSFYRGEEDRTYDYLLIDQTEAAREALQNEAIEKVFRLEYTLHPHE